MFGPCLSSHLQHEQAAGDCAGSRPQFRVPFTSAIPAKQREVGRVSGRVCSKPSHTAGDIALETFTAILFSHSLWRRHSGSVVCDARAMSLFTPSARAGRRRLHHCIVRAMPASKGRAATWFLRDGSSPATKLSARSHFDRVI